MEGYRQILVKVVLFQLRGRGHPHTVVGFKLSGPFKFFFVIINVRVTFLDVKGPIKWACDKIQGFFHIFYPYSAKNMKGTYSIDHMDDAILIVSNRFWFYLSSLIINVFLIEPWQHAGLVYEGSWVRSSEPPFTFFSFISLKFFFHKKSWVQIPDIRSEFSVKSIMI